MSPLDGVTVVLAAGFEGLVAPGRPFPVVTTVEANRLVRGTPVVRVQTDAGWEEIRREIEVPGGATREYPALAPGDFGPVRLVRAYVESGGQHSDEAAARTEDPAGTVFVRAAVQSGPPEGGRNFVLYEQEPRRGR
jgi:hypothetical protein